MNFTLYAGSSNLFLTLSLTLPLLLVLLFEVTKVEVTADDAAAIGTGHVFLATATDRAADVPVERWPRPLPADALELPPP